ISSSDGLAVLPPNAALVAGAKAFSVTLETPGSSTLTATDVTNGTKTAYTTVSITVTNTAPSAVNDSYSTVQDGTLNINAPGVLANDSDPEGQAVSVGAPRPATSPAHGSVSLAANGSFDYTPDAGYSGNDSFTYSVTDGFASSTATVTISISATGSIYVS